MGIDTDAHTGGCVATVGTFDGVHTGHRLVLQTVHALAEERGLPSLALTFDSHPLSVICPQRAPQQICPAAQRASLMSAHVNRVETLHFDSTLQHLTAAQFIHMLAQRYGVRTLVMGYDNGFGADRPRNPEVYTQAARAAGMDIVRCPAATLPDGTTVSSTAVRTAIAEGNMERTALMLGRPLSLSGTVVTGRQLGRTIGFPTANIRVDANQALPAPGVYAASTVVDGTAWPVALNIGSRPTLDDGRPLTVEAHLIGYSGNLYGHTLSVDVLHRVRPEQRFDGIPQLQQQIKADVEAILQHSLT